MRTLSIAVFCAVAPKATAQTPFSLDTSFRTEILSRYVNTMVVLDDGKLLLSGEMKYAGDMSWRGSTRLNTDGSRDISFPNFPQTLGGGKLMAWANKYYVTNGLVRRLLPSGLVDTSFIMMNDGPYFLSLQPGDYHVYPDGRILMSGTHTLSDTVRGFVGNYDLIWFSNTGYLDTTRTHRKGNGAVYWLRELPNGQFICSSTCTQFEGKTVDWIFRFDSLGVPDTTFRTDVYVGDAPALLPLLDGRVYVGGNFRRNAAPQDTLRMVRFLLDGTLDPTFAIPQFGDGTLNYPIGPIVTGLYPMPNGEVLVVGQFQYVNSEPRNGLCVLDSLGQLRPQFDGCGVDTFTFFGITNAMVTSVSTDTANGFLYVCGAYNGYNDGVINDTTQRFVSRLFLGSPSTASAQAAESTTGMRVYPNPTSGPVTVEVATSGPQAVCTLRDALGRACATEPLIAGRALLDVSALAPGLYHLHVVQAGTWVTGAKLIVE